MRHHPLTLVALLSSLSLLAACPASDPERSAKKEVREVRHAAAEPRIAEGDAIEHTLRFPDAANHYLEVETVVPTGGKDSVELSMAVWTPGSYLVREYSRHVEALTASDLGGAPLAAEKVRKNRWRIATGGAPRVVVRYRLYANEMTVRTNFVDADLAVLNGAPTFLRVADDDSRAHDVLLELPASWERAVTGLRAHDDGRPAHFVAASYDELVDSPIIAGEVVVDETEIDGTPHIVAYLGELSRWDVERSTRDVAAIVAETFQFWGVVPYERYAFLNVLGGGRGGLEHLDSTLMLAPPLMTTRRDRYIDWLSLASHEFFHTWNIKRLRPRELGPFDYENEVYTRGLWIAEGITSYYGDLLLRRAGLIDRSEYVELLSKELERLQTTPGRAVQSLAQASYDAWIKYYRPDENSRNTGVSYYTKGAIVGFLLDAEIRRATHDEKSLDDVMRTAYERYSADVGFTSEEFRAVVAEVAGRDLEAFFAVAVDGTGELDYEPALEHFGLVLSRPGDDGGKGGDGESDDDDDQPSGWLGAKTSGSERVVVSRVERETPASQAGLGVGDELVAIDGFRVDDLDELLASYRPGARVELTIARRGVLRTLPVTLGEEPETEWKLRIDKGASATQSRRLAEWLGPETTAPAAEVVATTEAGAANESGASGAANESGASGAANESGATAPAAP